MIRTEVVNAGKIYEKIVQILEKPIRLTNGIDIYLRISVGVASYPEAARTADDLIQSADIAMYHVKDKERNSIAVFQKEMLDEFMENVNLENRLKEAVCNGDFYLFFNLSLIL
jgi:predicted signal transduction protein with EAL and GGDEF domain